MVAALAALGASCLGAPAFAGWPNAAPAQPLAQAPWRCALNITPLNRRCHVVDFTDLGQIGGRHWYYAFYHTHWADRHGKMDRGFPIFFYLQGPATLRLGLWVDDAPGVAGVWAKTPPPRPAPIIRPEASYLGVTLRAVRGQDDQRLFRLDGRKWRQVSVLYRSDEDRALIDKAMPAHCEPVDEGDYDWAQFRFVMMLKARSSGAVCGAIVSDIAVRKDRVYLADAVYARPPVLPPPSTDNPNPGGVSPAHAPAPPPPSRDD